MPRGEAQERLSDIPEVNFAKEILFLLEQVEYLPTIATPARYN
jgi:hypothetical protein